MNRSAEIIAQIAGAAQMLNQTAEMGSGVSALDRALGNFEERRMEALSRERPATARDALAFMIIGLQELDPNNINDAAPAGEEADRLRGLRLLTQVKAWLQAETGVSAEDRGLKRYEFPDRDLREANEALCALKQTFREMRKIDAAAGHGEGKFGHSRSNPTTIGSAQ